MSTPFYQRVDADLAKSLGALGQSFVFDGETIACGITRPSAGNTPMEGGSWEEYSGAVFTRRALLTTVPKQGDLITVDGEDVFVGKVKSVSSSPLVTILFQNEPPAR